MSRRHEQINHRNKLNEIRNIMNSMKTLSIMENHKLEKLIETQLEMTSSIDEIANDYLQFNPQVLQDVNPVLDIVVLIGAQRGFCGDFNLQILHHFEHSSNELTPVNTTIISVGNKLHPLVSKSAYRTIELQGADVVEGISSVLDSLADILSVYNSPISLNVIYHQELHNKLAFERLLPPFMSLQNHQNNRTIAPLLYLKNRDFFLQLTDFYLFNALRRILYVSLMIENQHRIQHLENANHHLDDKTEALNRKINALRQEEIIEEIEVILLNSTNS